MVRRIDSRKAGRAGLEESDLRPGGNDLDPEDSDLRLEENDLRPGGNDLDPEDSDLRLEENDLRLVGSDLRLAENQASWSLIGNGNLAVSSWM
jgi:hypothetical protein